MLKDAASGSQLLFLPLLPEPLQLYHTNEWLFVSFRQIKRACSAGAFMSGARACVTSSWITAVDPTLTWFMSLSSLSLSAQKHEGQLSVMQLMDMLTGVASGMKYLTEMGFIHKRLAAHKVREQL